MITSEMATEMVLDKRPAFIFTSGGLVQYWIATQGTGPIVATNREAANVVKIELEKMTDKMISIEECGSAQGETLAARHTVAMSDRAVTGMFVGGLKSEMQLSSGSK